MDWVAVVVAGVWALLWAVLVWYLLDRKLNDRVRKRVDELFSKEPLDAAFQQVVLARIDQVERRIIDGTNNNDGISQ